MSRFHAGLSGALFVAVASITGAADVDPRQQFPLTPRQGPIMVRVATFLGEDAVASANDLARQLREQHGIEAYTFRYQRKAEGMTKEQVEEYVRRYRVKPRVPVALNPPPVNWVVFAGNFEDRDEPGAQRLLRKIYSMDAGAVRAERGSLIKGFRRASDRKKRKPFSNASLFRNPLLVNYDPLTERTQPRLDEDTKRLLRQVNSDDPLSALNIAQDYTILVALFTGSTTIVESEDEDRKLFDFKKEKSGIRIADENAVKIAQLLRQWGFPAYVFRDLFGSTVCVGGFVGPNDPNLKPMMDRLSRIPNANALGLRPPQLIDTPRIPN